MSYKDNVRASKEKVRQAGEERNQKISYQILKDTSKKRFLTVGVGAIDKIEQKFGDLWGNDDIEEEDMDATQLKYFNLFLELRNEIFDQCNSQIKKFENDLSSYNINRDPISNKLEFKKES